MQAQAQQPLLFFLSLNDIHSAQKYCIMINKLWLKPTNHQVFKKRLSTGKWRPWLHGLCIQWLVQCLCFLGL